MQTMIAKTHNKKLRIVFFFNHSIVFRGIMKNKTINFTESINSASTTCDLNQSQYGLNGKKINRERKSIAFMV